MRIVGQIWGPKMYVAKQQCGKIGSKHLDNNMITLLKQIPSPLSQSLNAHYLNASLISEKKNVY